MITLHDFKTLDMQMNFILNEQTVHSFQQGKETCKIAYYTAGFEPLVITDCTNTVFDSKLQAHVLLE